MNKVIVCSPRTEYFRVEEPGKHNISERANRDRAIEQHATFRRILEEHGVEVINVGELGGHPNSVFTRDTAVCTPSGFIKLRMGLPTRRGEEEWMEKILDKMGIEKIGEIKPLGTVEGGDVIITENYAFIGISGRTNMEGARQISDILKNEGYSTRMIRVPGEHLHLGGAMSVLLKDTILAVDTIPQSNFDGFDVLTVPEGNFITGNVISLGRDVIVEKRNKNVGNILQLHGFRVIYIDLSEFVRGNGGPSCLILPVE